MVVAVAFFNPTAYLWPEVSVGCTAYDKALMTYREEQISFIVTTDMVQ